MKFVTYNIFLDQQFIIQNIVIVYSSYFITTYIRTNRKIKRKSKKNKNKRKNYNQVKLTAQLSDTFMEEESFQIIFQKSNKIA